VPVVGTSASALRGTAPDHSFGLLSTPAPVRPPGS